MRKISDAVGSIPERAKTGFCGSWRMSSRQSSTSINYSSVPESEPGKVPEWHRLSPGLRAAVVLGLTRELSFLDGLPVILPVPLVSDTQTKGKESSSP